MKPATDSSLPHWTIRSEHSGAFLRLQRLVKGRASFTLCFLTYSDSVYRDEVAGFLEGRLNAHVRVAIDPEERIGTEVLFDRLSEEPDNGPAQLMRLESWPESLDDLPVFERLGDILALAITQGRIAEILQARGQLDDALRIYEEQVLPSMEALKLPAQIDRVRARIEELRAKLG